MKPLQFYIVLKVLHPISSAVTLQVPISLVDSVDSEGHFFFRFCMQLWIWMVFTTYKRVYVLDFRMLHFPGRGETCKLMQKYDF